MAPTASHGRPSRRRSFATDWRVYLGFGITIFLLWWVLRGVDPTEVLVEIRGADWLLLGLAVAVTTAGFGIRAMRWEILLRPIRRGTSLRSRFAAVNIGFMANNLLPLRVGEFARAYALSRMEPVRMSGAFGSLAVERFLDAFSILALLVVAVMAPGFPDGATVGGRSVGSVINGATILVAVILAFLVVMVLWPRRLVRAVEAVALRFLAGDTLRRIVDVLEAFLEGVTALRKPRLLVLGLLWSVGFWMWHSFSFWLGFRAFGIDVSFAAALFVNAVVAFAVAVPSSPGFFGTFHAGAALALVGVYGVAEGPTLAFAFGYHLGGFIPVTVIGLYYAWRLGLSLHELEGSEEAVERAVEESGGGSGASGSGSAPSIDEAASDGVPSLRSVVVDAPAKVNLFLRIYDLRPSGFHDLETLFQGIGLHDTIHVRERSEPGVELVVEREAPRAESSAEQPESGEARANPPSSDVLGPQAENLAYRAALAYRERAGIDAEGPGLEIRLVKRIPAGGGLGGGSSDAGAVLRALHLLRDGALPREELLELAADLGSDVPFFLSDSPLALGRGRGERLHALPALEARPVVVLIPDFRISTADAFEALDGLRDEGTLPSRGPATATAGASDVGVVPVDAVVADGGWDAVSGLAENDFHPVISTRHPEIPDLLGALREAGARFALLSGSGSTLFGVFDDPDDADRAAATAGERDAGVRAVRTETLEAWPEPQMFPTP